MIADHLGWFRNESVTVEDLVKERGEEVLKVSDMEWTLKDNEKEGDREEGKEAEVTMKKLPS